MVRREEGGEGWGRRGSDVGVWWENEGVGGLTDLQDILELFFKFGDLVKPLLFNAS